MKTRTSSALKYLCFNSFIYLAALICSTGCVELGHHADPLAGWNQVESNQIPVSVVKDYQDYINGLSPTERYYTYPFNIRFFENDIGQKAVKISIPLDGKWYEHILIYGKDTKRIQVIKYISGRYVS